MTRDLALVTLPARQTIVCGADGAAGFNGADGARGSDGGFSGADGGRGGDAGPATPGKHANQALVVLKSSASAPELPVNLVSIRARANGAAVFDGQLGFSRFESIDASARGGKGGRGGHGGNGGDGARGRSGSDATRYSSGTDGGPGGDGGDGGRGTDGARGGDGGHVVVVVDERDAYLLMAVDDSEAPEARVCGGDGGAAGAHGYGGSGGPGGSGGSSYSWTETHTETSTDSNGNTTTSTRTTYHSNPGGSNGPSGYPGRTPSSPLQPGAHGSAGRFEIVVGNRSYPRRYDLALNAFELVELVANEGAQLSASDGAMFADGVYEPGEIVGTSRFELQNVGRMPTPRHQRVRLTLAAGALVYPLGDEAFLDVSLEEGDVGRLHQLLRFRIRDQHVESASDPLVWTEEVTPIAEQLGVEVGDTPAADSRFVRQYRGVTLTRTLVARFPICNHGDIRVLRSLAPGERSRMLFDVHNISRKDLGRASESGRVVAVHLTWEGGELSPHDVSFVDAAGAKHDFVMGDAAVGAGKGEIRAGYYAEVPLVRAGEHVVVEGVLGVARTASAYASARLRYTLLIERLDAERPGSGEQMRVVQMRDVTIRVEPGYHREDDTRVLLVTTDVTSQAAHRAWHQFLGEELGLPTDDWSLTRYGHLDLRAPLDDGTDLYTHLEDKLVIVLNDPFHPRSEPVQEAPADYVRGVDFRLGATRNGTHLLAVGAAPFDIGTLMRPCSEERHGGDDIDTVDQLYEKERKASGTLAEDMFKDDLTRVYDVVTVTKTCLPFMRPKDDALAAATRRIERRLRELSPQKRHVLVMRPHGDGTGAAVGTGSYWPRKVGHTFGIFPRYELGVVEVRRTLDRDTPAGIVVAVDGAAIAEPSFEAGRACRFAALLALPFTDKLAVLDRFMRRAANEQRERVVDDIGPLLVDAILADVAEEISAALARTSLDDVAALENACPSFMRLTRFALLQDVEVRSAAGRMLLSLCGGLLALSRAPSAWWRIAGKRSRMAAFLAERSETFTGLAFGGSALIEPGHVGSSPAAALLARIVAEHERDARELAEYTRNSDTCHAMLELLSHPERGVAGRRRRVKHAEPEAEQLSMEIARDTDALLEPSTRIWSVAQLEHYRAVEAEHLRAQRELRELNRADRAAMLVTAVKDARETAPLTATTVPAAAAPAAVREREREVAVGVVAGGA